MNKMLLRGLIVIIFLHSGNSNSSLNISQMLEGSRLNVTCKFTGEDNISQINWESLQDSNRTNIGSFLPQGGSNMPEHMKVHTEWKKNAQSSMSLELSVLNMSAKICCVFMTFPSGILRQCTHIKEEIIHMNTMKSITPLNAFHTSFPTLAEAQGAGYVMGVPAQFGAVIIGSILSLWFFVITVSCCHSYCCKRQVFNVQQAYLTDTSASTQLEETQETPITPGFDPAKLYAKIKEDLYYGRLWKSYQGRSRLPVQGSPSPPRQIYYQLGEKPSQTKDESPPKDTDTMLSSKPEINSESSLT
ncbi:immunoglobulin domain-containing protein isoform X2 [Hoplias malabaricus]|uniref:immunoglobulin domain-containing protein isoform X2 n=1 Tax=Hoplias malabaricus TaxID=27720 RepID=UPI0034617E19